MKILITLSFVIISVFGIAQTPNQIIEVSNNVQLIKLTDEFYIHNTFTDSEIGRFWSNGVLVVKNGKALMIDSPTSVEETKIIEKFLQDSLHASISLFIGGHYHIDCIGGMDYFKQNKIHTILGEKTNEKCVEFKLPLPDETFKNKLDLNFEGIPLECLYFGGGHTADNIVVFFPNEEILFGGCLIKSADSQTMGNLADAVPSEWAGTVEKVLHHCQNVNIVVPGHGNFGGKELLTHTIELAHHFFD